MYKMTGKSKMFRPSTVNVIRSSFYLDWVQQVSRNLNFKHTMNMYSPVAHPVMVATP